MILHYCTKKRKHSFHILKALLSSDTRQTIKRRITTERWAGIYTRCGYIHVTRRLLRPIGHKVWPMRIYSLIFSWNEWIMILLASPAFVQKIKAQKFFFLLKERIAIWCAIFFLKVPNSDYALVLTLTSPELFSMLHHFRGVWRVRIIIIIFYWNSFYSWLFTDQLQCNKKVANLNQLQVR